MSLYSETQFYPEQRVLGCHGGTGKSSGESGPFDFVKVGVIPR